MEGVAHHFDVFKNFALLFSRMDDKSKAIGVPKILVLIPYLYSFLGMEGVLMRRLCMVAYKTMSLTLATISTSFRSVLYFYLVS